MLNESKQKIAGINLFMNLEQKQYNKVTLLNAKEDSPQIPGTKTKATKQRLQMALIKINAYKHLCND